MDYGLCIFPTEYAMQPAELAKALAGAWFDAVRFHARTYSKDHHYWRLIPTGMKPRVRAYLYQRANT